MRMHYACGMSDTDESVVEDYARTLDEIADILIKQAPFATGEVRRDVVELASKSRRYAEEARASRAPTPQSMEIAQASVRSQEDIAAALERIADALERAHPLMYEWMACNEELNGQPRSVGEATGWSGHAWDTGDSYKYAMRWRRPLGDTGPWERVR